MEKEEFKQIRESLGLSKSHLGRILGFDYQSVWRFESGRQAIPKVVSLCLRLLSKNREEVGL